MSRLRRWKDLAYLLPLAPILLLLAALYVYPLWRTVYLSFGGTALTIRSYVAFFQTSVFVQILVFTIVLSVVVTILCLIIGYPVAYELATAKETHRDILFALILAPWLIPELVRNFSWLVILQSNGVLASVQHALGFGLQPVIRPYTVTAVLVGIVSVQLPLTILPLYAVFRRVDLTLLSAASTLGARPVQVLRTILIPLTMPGIAVATILTFLTTLGFYVTPVMLGGPQNTFMANLIDVEVSKIVNWQFGSAMSVILVVAGLGVMALAGRAIGLRWLLER